MTGKQIFTHLRSNGICDCSRGGRNKPVADDRNPAGRRSEDESCDRRYFESSDTPQDVQRFGIRLRNSKVPFHRSLNNVEFPVSSNDVEPGAAAGYGTNRLVREYSRDRTRRRSISDSHLPDSHELVPFFPGALSQENSCVKSGEQFIKSHGCFAMHVSAAATHLQATKRGCVLE